MSPTTKPLTDLYTPREVSELINVPSSTLRHWASKVYTDYLSQYAKQRRRQYTGQDLSTLARIKELSDKGTPVNEIIIALGEIEIIEVTADDLIPTNLALIPALAHQQSQLDEINAKLDKLLEQDRRSWWDRLRGR